MLRLPSFTESLEVARGWGRNSEAPHLWNGLAANWNFLQGGGSTLYDIAGSNHGTLTNMDPATDWVMTEKGWALDFDGSNDGVLIDEIAGNISQGTVVALTSVKATVGGNIKGLLGQAGASLQNEWNLNPSLGRHDMLFDDGNFARIDWGGASDIPKRRTPWSSGQPSRLSTWLPSWRYRGQDRLPSTGMISTRLCASTRRALGRAIQQMQRA